VALQLTEDLLIRGWRRAVRIRYFPFFDIRPVPASRVRRRPEIVVEQPVEGHAGKIDNEIDVSKGGGANGLGRKAVDRIAVDREGFLGQVSEFAERKKTGTGRLDDVPHVTPSNRLGHRAAAGVAYTNEKYTEAARVLHEDSILEQRRDDGGTICKEGFVRVVEGVRHVTFDVDQSHNARIGCEDGHDNLRAC
jgi:hypothetical protein